MSHRKNTFPKWKKKDTRPIWYLLSITVFYYVEQRNKKTRLKRK